ncbi:MAG TPA: hypothetical protein VFZ19_05740 [Solirubrobacterales bacterium]
MALVAAAALLVSGCGGDEASADVTKAQFTKEAEAICAERSKKWNAAVATFAKQSEEVEGVPTFQEEKDLAEAFFAESVFPLLETELKALEELDRPAADEEKIEKMLQNRARLIEELEDRGTDALINSKAFDAFEKEAQAYGWDCSFE